MSTAEEIKSAIRKLPRRELRNIASWISDTDQREWDEDIQKDIEHGLWEELAEDALKDHNDNKTREL